MSDKVQVVQELVDAGFTESDAVDLVENHGGHTYVGRWLHHAMNMNSIRNLPAFIRAMVTKQAPVPMPASEAREAATQGKRRYIAKPSKYTIDDPDDPSNQQEVWL